MHELSPSHTVLRLSVSSIVSRDHCFHSTFLLCQFGNLAFLSGFDVVDSGLQSLSQKNIAHFVHPAVQGIFDVPIHLLISGMSLIHLPFWGAILGIGVSDRPVILGGQDEDHHIWQPSFERTLRLCCNPVISFIANYFMSHNSSQQKSLHHSHHWQRKLTT